MSKIRLLIGIAVLVIALSAVPVLSACGQVAEYSDPIAENLLVSMNNGDYASFSKDFDTSLLAEAPEDVFNDMRAAIMDQLGKYLVGSKDMTGVNIENGITTAVYQVDFEKAEDFQVRFVYQEIGGEMKLVGFWFDG